MLDLIWLIPVLPLAGFVVAGAGSLLGARSRGPVATVACGTVGLSFALSISCFWSLSRLPAGAQQHVTTLAAWIEPLHVSWSFLLDPLSAVMILVVTGVGLLIHIYSIGYMWDEEGYWRYFAFLNLFMAMMLTLVLGASLPVLFVGWEGVGLCSYLLIGFFYTRTYCADAGRKAFIVNRIGDASFILGMLLVWSVSGMTFDIATIIERAPEVAAASPLIVTAVALLLFGGACGKSAQIPLHVWLPDAMAGPTPVSALIHAATMVTAGVYLLCRLSAVYVLAPAALGLVAIVGAATALMAALIAMAQDDIKKVLAYSTISQLGYMFLAVGVGAFTAAIFHLTTHAFFKGLLFLGSGAVIHALHGEQDMRRMGGLKARLPWTFLCFAAGWIAIVGVPLTSGFFSKDEILYETFLHDRGLWLAGMIGAVMTALYMTRLMGLTFFGASRVDESRARQAHEAPKSMLGPMAILAVLSVVGGVLGLPAVVAEWAGWSGPGAYAAWLAPVFGRPEAVMASRDHAGPGVELFLMMVSSVVALGGIGVGYYLWVTRPELPDRLASSAAGVYRFVKGKLFVDELYDHLIVRPYYGLCRILARFDAEGVDGTVNGVGSMMRGSGQVLKLLHSGLARNYALIYLAGAAVIVWYMVAG